MDTEKVFLMFYQFISFKNTKRISTINILKDSFMFKNLEKNMLLHTMKLACLKNIQLSQRRNSHTVSLFLHLTSLAVLKITLHSYSITSRQHYILTSLSYLTIRINI